MKAQCLSSDRISALPSSIIETILCLLPLQDAGRTSILSKRWRYSWTQISKLEFDEDDFKVPPSKNQLSDPEKCEFVSAVCQAMSLHHGPIHEFTLSMTGFGGLYYEIDQIIAHLLRYKTVKTLFLWFPCKLPVYIFSLDQLTFLFLGNCVVKNLPIFSAFGSLRELYLHHTEISREVLMQILSNNPLLKRLTMCLYDEDGDFFDDTSTVIELFKCLPVIEEFTASNIKYNAEDATTQALPTSLVHLKYLCIKDLYFASEYELGFLGLMLRSSPSLEELELELDPYKHDEDTHNLEDYSDIRLDHLVEFEIRHFNDVKSELEFVKLILANSPVLKKVRIFWDFRAYICDREKRDPIVEKMNILRFLSRCRRASPMVEITVQKQVVW